MPRVTIWLTSFALLAAPIGPIAAQAGAAEKVRYAKTEVEKASGKCVGSILGGALVGALLGRAVGGKNGTVVGLAAGAAAGTAICVVLVNNAKRRDRIIAAQIASANYQRQSYETDFAGDNGQAMHFSGSAGASRQIDSAQLQPVRYKVEGGGVMASPVLDTGGHECRSVSSNLSGAGASSALPNQMVCRTAEGDWQPYGMKNI